MIIVVLGIIELYGHLVFTNNAPDLNLKHQVFSIFPKTVINLYNGVSL